MPGQILPLSNTQAKQLAGKEWRFNGQVWKFKSYDPRSPGQPPWKSGAEGKAYPLLDASDKPGAYVKFFSSDTAKRFNRTQWLIAQGIHLWLPHLAAAPSHWLDSRTLSSRPVGVDFDLTGCLAAAAPGETWLELKYRLCAGAESLPAQMRWRLAEDLILALAALEKAGLVHGDLSPNNLLIHTRSPAGQPALYLIDFDAFVAPSMPGTLALTVGEGGTFGTDGYCPPELAERAERGDLAIAPYSDRRARDMLLLEFLVAGKGAPEDKPPAQWDASQLGRQLQSLLNRSPAGRSAAVQHLAATRVFAQNESERPTSTKLAEALGLPVPQRLLAPPSALAPPPRPQPKPAVAPQGRTIVVPLVRPLPQPRRALWVVAAVILLLLVAVGAYWVNTQDAARAKVVAQAELKAKVEAETKARVEAEAKAKTDQEAKAKAEAELQAKAEAETKVRVEAEAEAKVEREAKTRDEAAARATATNAAEAKTKLEAEAKTKGEAEAKALVREKEERGVIPEPKQELMAKQFDKISTSDQQKLSYAWGMNIGTSLKNANYELDLDVLTQEIRDAMAGVPPKMNEQDARQAITTYQGKQRDKNKQTDKISTSDQQKLSYALGMNIGTSLKNANYELDLDVLTQEIRDAMAGVPPKMNEQDARQAILTDQREKRKQMLGKNNKEGETFLETNKAKPGVITLPNGLQYKVLAEGSGESPKAEDTVEVNYRGTFMDGTEFDSNTKSGKPATFAANRVMPGWTEALTRMKPGAKWQLFIPSNLAYGERGSPPRIQPNSLLLFDVELLSFTPAPPVTTAPPAAQPFTKDIIKVPSLEEMKKGAKIETIKAEDVEKLQKQQAEKPKEETK